MNENSYREAFWLALLTSTLFETLTQTFGGRDEAYQGLGWDLVEVYLVGRPHLSSNRRQLGLARP